MISKISNGVNGQNRKRLTYKGEAVKRLWSMGYNLIPILNKVPLVKWKKYQTVRITGGEMTEWSQHFAGANWSLLTGQTPYSDAQAIVVLDSDDEEADVWCGPAAPRLPACRGPAAAAGTGCTGDPPRASSPT